MTIYGKSFYTQCYANDKDVTACGHKIPMYIIITALLALENIATIELRSGHGVLFYVSIGLMNGVFTIGFFRSRLKYIR